MLNIKAFLTTLTTHPGVYQMLGENGKILYIGKARNLKKRVASYFSKKNQDNKTLALIKHLQDIHVIVTHDENEALLLECNLIKKYQPHYNILFRDDKSYPYILITHEEPYPCIDFYRGNKKAGGHYFGPYPSAGAVRETIHLIQKLFGLRTCQDRYRANRTRPCLQYQIGLCSGSCASQISQEDYAIDIKHAILFLQGKNEQVLQALNQKMEQAAQLLQYEAAAKMRDQIAQLREMQAVSFATGDVDVIGYAGNGTVAIQWLVIRGGRILGSRTYFPKIPINSTPDEIITSFLTQHYLSSNREMMSHLKEIIVPHALRERTWLMSVLSQQALHKISLSSNVRGERKKWLNIANKSAHESLASHLLNKTTIQERFVALQSLLHLPAMPARIECFDISHTMGEETVASCVVFNKEGPFKNDYRRFNIKDITPGDDTAAMQQVLMRRYHKIDPNKIPDILLIDGGLPQLNAAHKMLATLPMKSITLIGVAKGVTRKPGLETLYIDHKPPIHLASDSPALHLIQQIRDEAHRFAITGHRKKRDKKRRTSTLESIPGIGKKRSRDLLRYFGGIQAINRASLEELAKVPGISQALAEKIFAALHDVMM